MSDEQTSENSPGERWGIADYMSVYERAQEAAYHSDVVVWEITAITWGANTLLLGFILEAIEYRRALPLIALVSIVGMVLTALVARVFYVARVTKEAGYGICQAIEKHSWFPDGVRLHTEIDRGYPKRMGLRWVSAITVVFEIAWLSVLSYALWLFFCNVSVHTAG